MPSQVLTKRRVKRRQQRQRIVSKNAKRNVRSVRKHRKTAKKVMRGGMTSAQIHDFAEDQEGYNGSSNSRSTPEYKYGTAYVLYDKIPTTITKTVRDRTENISMNVPTCVIFIVGKKTLNVEVKDDVYLFFNNKMTVEEITTTVKLLLGMSMQDTFELTPPISPPKPLPENNELSALWNVGGNTFVKISACKLNTAYCVFSGTLDSPDTLLDQVKTNEHKITTTNRKYNEMNGQKLKTSLEDESANGFKNRVLNSKAVLPELYKKYFVAANPQAASELPIDLLVSTAGPHGRVYYGNEATEQIQSKSRNYFGKDIEWTDASVKEEGKEPPIKSWKITYPEFKKSMMKEIEETIFDNERHKTYGLDAAKIEQLNQKRPLGITKPMSIPYLELDATSIFEKINRNSTTILGDEFTGDHENWWVSKEAANLKKKVDEVQQGKKERVDWCAYDPRSRECIGENAWM